jgi:hypothetical protein
MASSLHAHDDNGIEEIVQALIVKLMEMEAAEADVSLSSLSHRILCSPWLIYVFFMQVYGHS